MYTNNTELSRRTSTFGHGHGIRSSIVSAIRRKGSALVSLSAILRGSRSSHRDPWTTDPDEERPSACHLENVTSPRYGSWSAGRNKTSNHRNRQFWTVSGARSGTKPNSTDTDHTPRMSRARSFVQSLRKRRGTFQTDYTSEEERILAAWDSNDESSEGAAPILALPSDCAGSTEPRSTFWLGVQKAVRDTVDENFSLHAEYEPSPNSSPDLAALEEQQMSGSNLAEEQHDWPPHQCRPSDHLLCWDILPGQPIWEPRTSILDWPCLDGPEHIPRSLNWIYDASGPANSTETELSHEETGIQTLVQAFENLSADLQREKDTNTVSRETLDARDEQLRKLRLAIESLAETLSPGVEDQVPGEVEERRDQEPAKYNPACTKTQHVTGLGQTSGSNFSSVSEDFDTRGRSESTSGFTSMSSEMIPGPPCSPDTSFIGSRRHDDEKLWEMQCTKYIMDLLMKNPLFRANPDVSDEESVVMVSRSTSTRQSLEDELLQVGESFDDDGNLDDGSDGVASVAEQSVEDEEETILVLGHPVM